MPGAEEFDRRMAQLADETGTGRITAGCEVNQPHAQIQHENLRYKHVHGGRAGYLGDPLFENLYNFMDGIARATISEEGSRLPDEMRDIADDLTDFVRINAPRDPDIGDVLALSGSSYVIDNGTEIYRQPPIMPRDNTKSESGWDRRG